MGMDYNYAGSASYPRFNDEVKGIVELFGGHMTTDRKPKEQCNITEYFMEKPLKYDFPKETPSAFVKWANSPFDYLTREETKEVFNFMKSKWNKVKKVSGQIAYEFETLVEDDYYWNIC